MPVFVREVRPSQPPTPPTPPAPLPHHVWSRVLACPPQRLCVNYGVRQPARGFTSQSQSQRAVVDGASERLTDSVTDSEGCGGRTERETHRLSHRVRGPWKTRRSERLTDSVTESEGCERRSERLTDSVTESESRGGRSERLTDSVTVTVRGLCKTERETHRLSHRVRGQWRTERETHRLTDSQRSAPSRDVGLSALFGCERDSNTTAPASTAKLTGE